MERGALAGGFPLGFCGSGRFSADGKLILIIGGREQPVRVWDIQSARCVHTLRVEQFDTREVAITRDAGRIVLQGRHALRVWDVRTGKCALTVPLSSDSYRCGALSRDGSRFLHPREPVGPEGSRFWLMDVETGRQTPADKDFPGGCFMVGGYGESVVLSPDGRYAMAGGGGMVFWDVEGCHVLKEFRDVSYQIYEPVISPDNRRAVARCSVGGDSTVAGFVGYDLLDSASQHTKGRGVVGRLLSGLKRERGPHSVAWKVPAASWENHVVGFLPDSSTILAELPHEPSPARGLVLSLVLWNVVTHQMRSLMEMPYRWHAQDVSPDGRWAILQSDRGLSLLDLGAPHG